MDVAERLAARLGAATIDCVLIAGSGLGVGIERPSPEGLGLSCEGRVALADLGLPVPGVPGHGKALVWGTLGGLRVAVQTGRLHPYEGHALADCTAPLQALLERAPRALILTCAVGALAPDLEVGSVVVLRDQINLFGPTPLVGPRFVDCGTLYDAELRRRLGEIGRIELGEPPREVVYAHARGPQYESPAEVEALRRLGGDVVGMSTTYEAILAAAHGVPTCAVGVVTNGAGMQGLSHAEVERVATGARRRLLAMVASLIAGIDR